jgi:hypothetical protein
MELFSMEGNVKKIVLFIGIFLMLVLLGCNSIFPKPTSESACEGQELCEEVALAEQVGSFTLRILRNLDAGMTYVHCDTTMTIWFNTDPQNPALGYLTFNASGESVCKSQIFATGSGGQSHTTTCDNPVSYNIDGNLKPSDDCLLTIETTEIMQHSEMNNCVNSALGPLPMDPSTLPPDEVTVFPPIQIKHDGELKINTTASIAYEITDIVVNKEIGCMFGVVLP